MAIEIRELLIKVKIEEPLNSDKNEQDLQQLKLFILKECRKEIRKQMGKSKDR